MIFKDKNINCLQRAVWRQAGCLLAD